MLKTKTRLKPLKFGQRYPWDRWFKKSRFRVAQGRDFMTMLHSMAQLIRNTAKERGLHASIDLKTEPGVILVTTRRRRK